MLSFALKTFKYFARSRFFIRGAVIIFFAALFVSALPLFLGEKGLKVHVGVIDEDNTVLSAALIGEAQKDEVFNISLYGGEEAFDAFSGLKTGALEAVFVIKKGYGDKISKGEYKRTVGLSFSPYSSLSKTLSDAFSALVLREFIKNTVEIKAAEYAGEQAFIDASEYISKSGDADIIKLNVFKGASGAPVKKSPIPVCIYILSVITAFYMLCAVSPPQNIKSLAERMVYKLGNAGVFSLSFFTVNALPFLSAAFILCLYCSFAISVTESLIAFLSFILYAFCLVGLLMAFSLFNLPKPSHLSLMAALCLINTVFAYPSGIFSGFSFLKFLFPAAMLINSVSGEYVYMLWLLIYAVFFIALGTGLKKRER